MSKRLEKKQRERKRRRKTEIFILVIVVVLAILYLIACSMVKDDKIVGRTSINGVDVSGLTEDQAEEQVREVFEKTYANMDITVLANEKEYKVAVFDCLSIDAEGAAKAANDYAHGNFLTRGFALIKARIFHNDYTWNPYVSDESLLRQSIEAAGLMDINTTVQTTYEVTSTTLVFVKGVTGVSVDEDGLVAKMKSAIQAADYESVIECPMLTGTVEATDVQAIYDKIHTKKSNATLDAKNDYKIVKSVRGVSFDVDEAAAALENAAEGEKVEVALTIKKPKITTKKLKKYLFRDVLGTCTTNVSGTNARISNVALAAKKINGTILLPGETFSYNDTVGERTAARGFQKAPAYSNGETVQELGGGICQVSSTLYKATLLSNLEIVEHKNHSYVSNYIGIGMDATVSWGGPDYQFKNDTDYPIKIVAEYSGGQVTCKILGAKLDKKTVEMTAETLSVNSKGTVYREDPDMEKGKTEVISSGHDGYVVQTYRNIYNGKGKLISSEKEAYCVYQKQDQVIRIGTKEADTDTSGEDAVDTTENEG